MPLREALEDYKKKRAPAISKREIDAQRIEIECVDTPNGKDEGYIVSVTPKEKKGGKGSPSTMEYRPPIKRVFESKAATLAYLEKAL
jgi:hypothetical protein